MSKELIIDQKPVEIIEYKGTRVISAKVVAEFHHLDVNRINEKFKRNRKYFNEGRDYFAITKDMVADCDNVLQGLFYHNSATVYLFTISGYLNFVKTINDDRAWAIYEQLKEAYFEVEGIMANQAQFLAASKKNRNQLTGEWQEHGAVKYGVLTQEIYKGIFSNPYKRKAKMNSEELTLLSCMELLESLKLQKHPEIRGDNALKSSIGDTAHHINAIMDNKPSISE